VLHDDRNETNMHELRINGRGRRAAGALLLGAVVLGGAVATAAAFNGRGADDAAAPASPAPATPAASPSAAPSAAPVISPTPEPTDGGGDAMPITVQLDNATGADVYVDIVDLSGSLEDARSGTPGDGMSVAPYTLRVENVDDRTLRLTWVDFPVDNALALYIDETGRRLVLVQPEPTGPTDAIGFDRELLLAFQAPIDAGDVEAFLQDGVDTPGE
jgi:hypothetical protein